MGALSPELRPALLFPLAAGPGLPRTTRSDERSLAVLAAGADVSRNSGAAGAGRLRCDVPIVPLRTRAGSPERGPAGLPEPDRAGGLPELLRAGGLPDEERAGGLPELLRAGGLPELLRAGGLPDAVRAGGFPEPARPEVGAPPARARGAPEPERAGGFPELLRAEDGLPDPAPVREGGLPEPARDDVGRPDPVRAGGLPLDEERPPGFPELLRAAGGLPVPLRGPPGLPEPDRPDDGFPAPRPRDWSPPERRFITPPSKRNETRTQKEKLGGAQYASQPLEKIRRRPTLPGGSPPSTIGAGGLHFRVRNGNGCYPAAIATGNLMKLCSPLRTP